MKKKILIFILAITSIFCFAFAGCQREDKTWVNTNYFNVNDNVLSCEVAYGAEDFNTQGKFSIHEEATYVISSDELGENVITDDFLPLSQGTNLYYLTVSYKSKSTTYTLSIYKRHLYTVSFNVQGYTINDQMIEEGKLAAEPVCQDWGKKFVWQFNFNAPITQNITINGSVDSLPVETINLEYYALWAGVEGSLVSKSFNFEVDSQVLNVAFQGKDVSKSDYNYYDDISLLEIQASAFNNNVGANKNIKIMTKNKIYDITVLVATYAITNVSDLNTGSSEMLTLMQKVGGATQTSTGNTNSGINGNSAAYLSGNRWSGYFVLGNDIDCKGENLLFSSWAYMRYGIPAAYKYVGEKYGFCGTIDGLGHAIKNACIDSTKYNGWCSFFGNLESTAVVKNIRFVNFVAKGTLYEGFFSYNVKGNFQNIYVEATFADNNSYGVFGHDGSKISKLENCTFIIHTSNNRSTTQCSLFSVYNPSTGINLEGNYIISDYTMPNNYYIWGGRSFSYKDNKMLVEASFASSKTVNLSGVTKVLKDGVDITDKVTITSSGVTFPFGVWDATSTFFVRGTNFARLINFTLE